MAKSPWNWKRTSLQPVNKQGSLGRIYRRLLPIPLMLAALVVTGCSSFKTQPNLPPNLAIRCENALVFEGDSLGELMLYTVDLLEQYHVCQKKMDAVAAWNDRA